MAATIEVFRQRAEIRDGELHCRNTRLREILEPLMTEARGSDPNPDLNIAQRIIEQLGDGRIVRYDRAEYDPNVIY
jgi:hypothetical protein